jgi:hypothetical protein
VGEEKEPGASGGAKVSEVRAGFESGAASLDDAQPATTMQAAVIATASRRNEWAFMEWTILHRKLFGRH